MSKPRGFLPVWDEIQKRDHALHTHEVRVGLFSDTRSEDGTMNMAELGVLMEQGSDDGLIPPRPFMKDTAKAFENEVAEDMEREFRGKGDFNKVYSTLGKQYARDTSYMIQEFSDPANRPSTIRKKKKNDPLVDSGKMMRSVKFKIGKKHEA